MWLVPQLTEGAQHHHAAAAAAATAAAAARRACDFNVLHLRLARNAPPMQLVPFMSEARVLSQPCGPEHPDQIGRSGHAVVDAIYQLRLTYTYGIHDLNQQKEQFGAFDQLSTSPKRLPRFGYLE